ncbi:MAG: xanthine phosphoribosyltransferase [Anaerolineaceae bacterium]|nr:xanthine phosphoribosyltransferase [Anaerolineaceae bacterium]
MQLLKERIQKDGKYLGNGILKVDRFINHQVDPSLMDACGAEFARLFAGLPVNKILTAEISGIAPALMTGKYMNLPVVYARKTKPITMPPKVYITVAPSHTKGHNVELIVSPEYLQKADRVLIIDDFLASGATIAGLVRLAETAEAEVLGIGTLVEKTFEGGRALLTPLGMPIHSLVSICGMDEHGIEFTDEFEA